MKQAHPVTSQLLFIPLIGFRPAATRVVHEPTETTANGTRLIVLAAAAAPDRTDVVIEWERSGDPATCPPGSKLLTHSNMTPLENGLTATLVVGTNRMSATTMRRRSMYMGQSIGAIDAAAFPPLATATGTAELLLTEGTQEWRVSLDFAPGGVEATALEAELTRDGVAVRATAAARHADELIVELEIEAARQIRMVGRPIPTPARFASTSNEDQRARTLEHRRVFGANSASITLEHEGGGRSEEVRRLFSFEPQQATPGGPYFNRFVVMFDSPSADAKSATIVVPFVELNDREPSVTADLRDVPIDVDLGEHRFRIISAETSGADQRQVVIEVAPSSSRPRFTQPARMQGTDEKNFAWNPELKPGEPISLTTAVGDPPIVTFTGAVLRVDGPLRLEMQLP